MSKGNGGPRWFGEKGMIRKNYDYGEGAYFGTPGGGEKSMGDFIKKKRKKSKDNMKKENYELYKDILALSNEFYKMVKDE